MQKQGLTFTEFGSWLKVSASSVEKAIKTGRITRDCVDGNRITDPERAAREFEENRKGTAGPGRPRKSAGREHDETLIEVQTRHEKIKIAERKLKLKRARGSTVDKKAAERRFTELCRGMSERMLNWPADAAGRLAAKHGIDAATFEIDLEVEMRTLLAGMTAESLTVGTARERAA